MGAFGCKINMCGMCSPHSIYPTSMHTHADGHAAAAHNNKLLVLSYSMPRWMEMYSTHAHILTYTEYNVIRHVGRASAHAGGAQGLPRRPAHTAAHFCTCISILHRMYTDAEHTMSVWWRREPWLRPLWCFGLHQTSFHSNLWWSIITRSSLAHEKMKFIG